MKSRKTAISPAIKAETNFGYVKDLPKHVHPLVCYYEYWRHSPEHIELVEACREAGVFEEGCKGNGLKQSLQLKIARYPDVFPISALLVIVKSAGFPEKPFRGAALTGYEESIFSVKGAVGAIPWRAVLALRRNFMMSGMSELEFFELSNITGDFRALSFDWRYTNAELEASFRVLVERIRPPQFPEPKKAGQNGRLFCSGVMVKLNQLAAYRVEQAGFDYERGRKLTTYVDIKGWKQGVSSAKFRIDNITKRPIFFR